MFNKSFKAVKYEPSVALSLVNSGLPDSFAVFYDRETDFLVISHDDPKYRQWMLVAEHKKSWLLSIPHILGWDRQLYYPPDDVTINLPFDEANDNVKRLLSTVEQDAKDILLFKPELREPQFLRGNMEDTQLQRCLNSLEFQFREEVERPELQDLSQNLVCSAGVLSALREKTSELPRSADKAYILDGHGLFFLQEGHLPFEKVFYGRPLPPYSAFIYIGTGAYDPHKTIDWCNEKMNTRDLKLFVSIHYGKYPSDIINQFWDASDKPFAVETLKYCNFCAGDIEYVPQIVGIEDKSSRLWNMVHHQLHSGDLVLFDDNFIDRYGGPDQVLVRKPYERLPMSLEEFSKFASNSLDAILMKFPGAFLDNLYHHEVTRWYLTDIFSRINQTIQESHSP